MGDAADLAMEQEAEAQLYNPKTDQWLPPGDPRLPKRSYAKRTPKDQRVRSTKGTTMPERLTKAQIKHELEVNEQLRRTLAQRRRQLQQLDLTAFPVEPPNNCTMFTVDVKFQFRGKRYQFLILRSGGKYFTTGTSPTHQKFETWEDLCKWLEGDDVYSHSNLEVLKSAGVVVSFESGGLETIPTEDVPF